MQQTACAPDCCAPSSYDLNFDLPRSMGEIIAFPVTPKQPLVEAKFLGRNHATNEPHSLLAAFRDWQRARAGARALRAMGQSALDDIGLSRLDLDDIGAPPLIVFLARFAINALRRATHPSDRPDSRQETHAQ